MASLLRQAGKRKARDNDDDEESEVVASSSLAAVGASRDVASRRNKQRVLLVPSRGVTSQMRHLVSDLESLMPHSKKDSKLDSKSNLHIINELAELNNCNNTLYFEARKHQDLYLWTSKTPNGPSAKLFVQNIHTMDELKLTGNCLKGSRPVLSFDAAFDSAPHWALLRELLTQAFGVPRSSRRTKPFVDHVLSFSVLDGKIWFRNYQIIEEDPGSVALLKAQELVEGAASGEGARKRGSSGSSSRKGDREERPPTLVEIGPRFVMTPIRIFEGSFGGATLYENPEYLSPNTMRHLTRHKKGEAYKSRSNDQDAFRTKVAKLQREKKMNELSTSKVFS